MMNSMTQLDLSSDFETHTALHFRNLAESDPASYGTTIVRQRLGELGVGLMLIPNQAAYDLSGGTVAAHPLWHPDLSRYTRQTIEVPLGSTQGIQVIRARVQTPTELEAIHGLDVLNGPKLREIGASKWRQYQLAGEYMPQTIVADETLPQELAAITGQRLVVKADRSQLSRDCHIIAREEVTQTVTALREELQARPNRKSSDIIVQAFAPGEKWSELRGRTEYAQNLLDVAESEEVRVYCFVSD